MMNDSFSVDLRQHLLATADERPGDGRLAAIVEGVAMTGQRHPLVARLTWAPRRMSLFPSTAVRYGLIAAALIATIVAAALVAGNGFQPPTVFSGTWSSTDPADGSTLTLVVGGGNRPSVHFEDDHATGAACVYDGVKVLKADGSGDVSDDRLDASFPEGGGCGSQKVDVALRLVYLASTDSLRDQDNVEWTRVQNERPRPSTSDQPTTSSATSDACVEIKSGDTYRGTAGSLALTAKLPAGAESWWHGGYAVIGDAFTLSNLPCEFGGQATIGAFVIRQVPLDRCAAGRAAVAATTPAAAIAALADQTSSGSEQMTGPDDVTIGGYPAKKFTVSVPTDFDATRCPDEVVRVWQPDSNVDDGAIGVGQTATIYLVDVDGVSLGIIANHSDEYATPAMLDAIEAIVDSLRIDPQGTVAPTSTVPPTSPAPAPHEGEATFTSAINGFSMGVPKGWQTRAATKPWTGGPLDFDSSAADVIFDPAKDGPYLIAASQAFSDVSGDIWRGSVLAWTCAGQSGHEFWSWRVDGIHSEQFGPCNSGSLIQTDTRGYLFRLVSPRAEKLGLTDTWDSLKRMLETVDLRPEDAVDPAGTAKVSPPCAEIAAGDTYTNRFGSPKLTATVPDGATSSWQGSRDAFELGGRCPGSVSITASTVDTILTDPCDPAAGEGGNTATPAEAAEAMAAHIGHRTSKPSDLSIDGHEALRLEISTEGSTCTDPFSLWPGTEVNPRQNAIIYLVDIGADHPLGIGVWYSRAEATPAQVAEAEAIVRSIRVTS